MRRFLMHRLQRITAALALVAGLLSAEGPPLPKRVLFIGNSYTYFNNLPEMLSGLAAAGGKGRLETAMAAPGGWRLKDHWTKGNAQDLVKTQRWDHVVLQDHSTLGREFYLNGKIRVSTDADFQTYAAHWSGLIRRQGAKPTFYLTWARKATPVDQSLLTAAYAKAAKDANGVLSPVGLAWSLARQGGLEDELFERDGSHPSAAGSYLAACTFYSTLYQASPEGLPSRLEGIPVKPENGLPEPGKEAILADLPAHLARRLQNFAWKAVQACQGGIPDLAATAPPEPPSLPKGYPVQLGVLQGTWRGSLEFFPEGAASVVIRITRTEDRLSGHADLSYGDRVSRKESLELQDLSLQPDGLRFSMVGAQGIDKLAPIGFQLTATRPGNLEGVARAQATRGDWTFAFHGCLSLRREDAPDPRLEGFGTGPLRELARLAFAGDHAALERRYTSLQGKVPLVEPDPGSPERSVVTFLYRGGASTRTVLLPQIQLGPTHEAEGAPGKVRRGETVRFKRLGDSQVWYLRLNLPNRTLLGYTIGIERENPAAPGGMEYEEHLDALNPESLAARGNVSILRLPEAPAQPWIVPDPGAPKGRLVRDALESKALGGSRHFSIYHPAQGGKELKVAFVFDGDYFTEDLSAATVLDNLIHQGRIPPTLVVFLDGQQTRDRDLVNNPAYAEFLAKELRPYILQNHPVSRQAQDSVLAGASFGGLASAYAALQHPECFGKVLSMSGAFWPPRNWTYTTPGWAVHEQESELVRAFLDTPRKPIQFYLDCGLYEWRMLMSNRSLRDVLQAKGYALHYIERPGTHNAVHWRNSLGDGLIALLGAGSKVGQ